jgi:ceramide glucosyltransferase
VSDPDKGNDMLKILAISLLVLVFSERIIKHLLIVLFFRRVPPPEGRAVQRVSILQPILSGDPTLAEGLDHNLRLPSRYALEWIWLLDEDDAAAQQICRELVERYPDKDVKRILLPPPGDRQNPKMVKLIAGAQQARGDVLCVLDDDTRLPDHGLEACLPYLDQPGAGLAFGLPYYVSFGNLWSQLVAYFVNSHNLVTYIPYAMLTQPVTINGMFYAMRREVFEQIGGFAGLEAILADDFAIAQRVRAHGYRLVQTPLRHAISTWVDRPRSYFHLIQRWFTFPRESMMRHLQGREKAIFYVMTLAPVLLPWLALAIPILAPGLWPAALAYFVYNYLVFAGFNRAYLEQASPWAGSYWVVLIPLLLPIQVLAAILAPQRITWRGHTLKAEAGGGFQFVQHRPR